MWSLRIDGGLRTHILRLWCVALRGQHASYAGAIQDRLSSPKPAVSPPHGPDRPGKRVKMRFAHLKTHHGFERMRLRGLSGARDEFHLAAIVQNLKTMALRLLGPPTGQVCASIA